MTGELLLPSNFIAVLQNQAVIESNYPGLFLLRQRLGLTRLHHTNLSNIADAWRNASLRETFETWLGESFPLSFREFKQHLQDFDTAWQIHSHGRRLTEPSVSSLLQILISH